MPKAGQPEPAVGTGTAINNESHAERNSNRLTHSGFTVTVNDTVSSAQFSTNLPDEKIVTSSTHERQSILPSRLSRGLSVNNLMRSSVNSIVSSAEIKDLMYEHDEKRRAAEHEETMDRMKLTIFLWCL